MGNVSESFIDYGINIGIEIGRKQVVAALLSKGVSIQFILDLGYTEEEINEVQSK